MILIIGSSADPHVVSVAKELTRIGHHFRIFDCFDGDSLGVDTSGPESLQIVLGKNAIDTSCVSSVWWRQKPRLIVPSHSVSAYYDYAFTAKEWIHLYEYLDYLLDGSYEINPRKNAVRASNKLWQLQRASAVGFATPRTLVTNNPAAAQSFGESLNGNRFIYKTLTPYINPTGQVTYTTIVDRDTISDFTKGVAATPCMFQEFIEKERELRITVVGDNMFPVSIDSNNSLDTSIDWRQTIFDDIYSAWKIDDVFRAKVLSLHRELGLVYGAYDFIIDKRGDIVFLEVNPAGQWMWLENRLGLPIGAAIAQELIRGSIESAAS